MGRGQKDTYEVLELFFFPVSFFKIRKWWKISSLYKENYLFSSFSFLSYKCSLNISSILAEKVKHYTNIMI